jgi:hypothetical protein
MIISTEKPFRSLTIFSHIEKYLNSNSFLEKKYFPNDLNKITTYHPSIRVLAITLIASFLFSVATDSAMWQDAFESEKLELNEKQSEDKTETEKEIDEIFPFDNSIYSAISEKNNTILLTHAKAFYDGEMREILTPPPQL